MSAGFYDNLADFWQKTKIEELGGAQPQEIMEELTKRGGRGVQSAGSRMNMPWLENMGRESVQDPAKTIAKASTAVGSWWLGNGLGGLMGEAAPAASTAADTASLVAPTAAQTASLTAEQMATMSAEELAKYMASQAPQGFANTMEAGLMDTGYTPSSLLNAARYGPGSGQSFGQTMGNYGQGLMGKMTSPGFRQEAARRYAMRQGMDMMTPEQPVQAPPQRFQQPQEPLRNPYQTGVEQELTEEEKQRLRAMGYQIPY